MRLYMKNRVVWFVAAHSGNPVLAG